MVSTVPARSFGLDGRPVARVTAELSVLDWLSELVAPALSAVDGRGAWEVDVREWSPHAPAFPPPMTAVGPLACFVLDRSTLSLPAWQDELGFVVDDAERGCHFMIRSGRVTLVPHTLPGRRWRYTLALILYELVAARARRDHLELHAAAVESQGRAMLAVGPKRAGKTTLALHLQRRGACRTIANDRVFVSPKPAVSPPADCRRWSRSAPRRRGDCRSSSWTGRGGSGPTCIRSASCRRPGARGPGMRS